MAIGDNMDHVLSSLTVDCNSSIVATSNNETLFLSSTGDVVVCRDFEHDHEFNTDGSESLISNHDLTSLRDKFNGINLAESNSKDGITKNLWGEPHQRYEDEFSCCDVNGSCHSKGLCGGAESSRSHYNCNSSMGTASNQKRERFNNSHSSSSNSHKNQRHEKGVAYVDSSDSFGRKNLTINTSRSIDHEEYDDVDMSRVNLGDHDQWSTPVMSFDYSCYEPPTPETPHSHDYEENRQFTSARMAVNGSASKHVSMPNLSEKSNADQLQVTSNLPTGAQVPMQKQSLEPHQILPRTHINKKRQKQTSIGPISNSGLPGIPTFLAHLSQIRITRMSAHPRGHHVLLVSDEGMLFSYGSNERGQLGLGKQHSRVTAPQLITPLLENGGKTVNCAAGLDYSLVVVQTEGSRIAHRRRQQQRSPNSNMLNERNTHQQMYAFGCNDNNKLGLLDPDKTLNKSHSGGNPRRRWRKSSGDVSPVESPEPLSPSSLVSTPSSTGDGSTNDESSGPSTNVYLPRRVALHCKIIPKKEYPETPVHNNKTTTTAISYGIFCIAASTSHSAALVKRHSGSVELYTWGRGDDGRLGLSLPDHDQPSTPTRRWEDTLCCASIDNDDATLNSLIDERFVTAYDMTKTNSNQSLTQHYVATPTMVSSLSMLMVPEKHPPLPKKNKILPRSPKKKQRPTRHDAKSLLLESEYVSKLALGPKCTHVVTSAGRWIAFGSSSDGLLALDGLTFNVYKPAEVNLPLAFGHEKITAISIGETHGIALTATGRAFTWGTSPDGALGRGNKSYTPIPQPLLIRNPQRGTALNSALTRYLRGEMLQRIASSGASEGASDSSPVAYIHAGKDMSIFILRSGIIQTCGIKSGRLGQGHVAKCVTSPVEIFGGTQMWRGEGNNT